MYTVNTTYMTSNLKNCLEKTLDHKHIGLYTHIWSSDLSNLSKLSSNLSELFDEFNNFSSQQNKDTENILNCKYYKIEEIQSLNSLNHKDALSFFHINTCSLLKNIAELEYLLDKTKIDFDATGISESRIKKTKSPINSIIFKDYSYESCPTES